LLSGTALRAAPFLACALIAAGPLGAQTLRTAAEDTAFQRHTTYDEMMSYLVRVRATSTDMYLSQYGESRQGRKLPFAVFSRPAVTQPWEATALGRPIVLLNANVHGGERTLRESLLILVRELATRGTPENALLDEMVVLVAPQINPDGFHTGQRGSRGNEWGIDLNRDYVKLEHPEIAHYVRNVINTWHPHVVVDGHNGCAAPYNICYQGPSHASPDQRITQLADSEIFTNIDTNMKANGFKSWYYQGGNERRWTTGGFEARIGRNYGGFINSIGILFESPGGQTSGNVTPGGQNLETGTKAGLVAFKSVLNYVRQNRDKVLATVSRARMETIAMGERAEGEVVVQMRYGPEDRRVTYDIAQGQGEQRRFVTITSDSLMKKPIPTRTRPRPYAYILPRDAVDAVAMLRRHNITVEMLADTARLDVAAYTVADVSHAPVYNHAATTRITVGEVVNTQRAFPRGTYVVRTGQVLGRLVAHMLEPETEDNVIYWNTMDAWIPRPRPATVAQASPRGGGAGDPDDDPPGGQRGGQQGPPLVPIFKLLTPRPLPTRIVE
jgi:hypothetical protein